MGSKSEKAHYYLFDAKYTIVKETDNEAHWYKRDRMNHEWIEDGSWGIFFYDLGFDVIEIDYDEANEEILNRRRLKGRWSATDKHLFEFENNG